MKRSHSQHFEAETGSLPSPELEGLPELRMNSSLPAEGVGFESIRETFRWPATAVERIIQR